MQKAPTGNKIGNRFWKEIFGSISFSSFLFLKEEQTILAPVDADGSILASRWTYKIILFGRKILEETFVVWRCKKPF